MEFSNALRLIGFRFHSKNNNDETMTKTSHDKRKQGNNSISAFIFVFAFNFTTRHAHSHLEIRNNIFVNALVNTLSQGHVGHLAIMYCLMIFVRFRALFRRTYVIARMAF